MATKDHGKSIKLTKKTASDSTHASRSEAGQRRYGGSSGSAGSGTKKGKSGDLPGKRHA